MADEDNWTLGEPAYQEYSAYSNKQIATLKEKILEDMEHITHCVNDYDGITVDDSCYKSDIEDILNKRFGF